MGRAGTGRGRRPQSGFPRLRVSAPGIAIGLRSYSAWSSSARTIIGVVDGFAAAGNTVIFSVGMAVSVEMHHMGDSALQAEVRAVIEHLLADRLGDWRVSILGSQANDRWEMKIVGPNAFERSYTLEGAAGEHRPEVIQVIMNKMLPGRKA